MSDWKVFNGVADGALIKGPDFDYDAMISLDKESGNVVIYLSYSTDYGKEITISTVPIELLKNLLAK